MGYHVVSLLCSRGFGEMKASLDSAASFDTLVMTRFDTYHCFEVCRIPVATLKVFKSEVSEPRCDFTEIRKIQKGFMPVGLAIENGHPVEVD